MLKIDHVIYGVRDLEAAARRFMDEYGLASYPGGRHTGRGTGNVIVPLGRDYVELLGVVDPEEATRAPTARWLMEQVAQGDRLVSWCLSADNFDDVAQRLGLTPSDWSRQKPDGAILRWRLAARETVLDNPTLPFFISWQVPADQHPSRTVVPHRITPRGIAWIEVGGHPDELTAWLGGETLPVSHVDGPPGVRAVGILTDDGEIVIR